MGFLGLSSAEVVVLFVLLVALALVYASSTFILEEEGAELVVCSTPGAAVSVN